MKFNIHQVIVGDRAPVASSKLYDNDLRLGEGITIIDKKITPFVVTYQVPLPSGYYSLETAVAAVPQKERREYLVILYQTGPDANDWEQYRFIGRNISEWRNLDLWQEFGDATAFINAPDEEDITENPAGTLQFKNRIFNPTTFSGLGRKILRANIVGGKNVLTQEMLNDVSTIYEIRYDCDLNGSTIGIPVGCTLDFQGGSLSNGTIKGDSTVIKGINNRILKNIRLEGTWEDEVFLLKKTVDDLRNLQETEAILLKGKYYKGVELHGYYEKGDTPGPIRYFVSELVGDDDGGSVLHCNYELYLKHDFGDNIDLSYFGASHNHANNISYLRAVISYIDQNKSAYNVNYFYKKPLKVAYSDEIVDELIIVSDIDFNSIQLEITGELAFSLEGVNVKNLVFKISGNNTKLLNIKSNSILQNIKVLYKSEIDLSDVYINPISVRIDSTNVLLENISIQDYKNTKGVATFIGIHIALNCFDITLKDISILNLKQKGNGVIGDTWGAVRGIYWHNITSDTPDLTICSGEISNVFMRNFVNVDAIGNELVEDADGIYIYGYSSIYTTPSICDILIRNVRLIDTGKRNIKIQASGVNIENSTLILNKSDVYENLMIFSRKTKITNCDFLCRHGFLLTGALSNSTVFNCRFYGNRETNSAFQLDGFSNVQFFNCLIKDVTSVFKYVTYINDFFKHEGFKNSYIYNSVIELSSTIDFVIGSGYDGPFEATSYVGCTFKFNISENIASKSLAPGVYDKCVFNIESISVSDFVFNTSVYYKYLFKKCTVEIVPSFNDAETKYIFKTLTFSPTVVVNDCTVIGNNKKVAWALINCGNYEYRNIDLSSLSDPNVIYTENNYPNVVNKNVKVSLENINLRDTQYIRFGSVEGGTLILSGITVNKNRKIPIEVAPLPRINLVGVVSNLICDNVYVKFNNIAAAQNVQSAIDSGIFLRIDGDTLRQYAMRVTADNMLYISTV